MGQIREQWKRMATEGGDWKTWIGIPKSPPATPPQPLTEKERQMLNTWLRVVGLGTRLRQSAPSARERG